ncbi:hypothetical protein [Nocardia miyunensis]|uniref:hypothetical protein n=1 Tax=Nocardia miyunensis TaxID=282684 RepID=UPI00350E3EF1
MGGKLVTSPTPRGKHAGTIRRLRHQLEAQMPPGLAAYQVSSIALPDDDDDYCTPDLVVLPDSWDIDDEWLADPADVESAVEELRLSVVVITSTRCRRGWRGRLACGGCCGRWIRGGRLPRG